MLGVATPLLPEWNLNLEGAKKHKAILLVLFKVFLIIRDILVLMHRVLLYIV